MLVCCGRLFSGLTTLSRKRLAASERVDEQLLIVPEASRLHDEKSTRDDHRHIQFYGETLFSVITRPFVWLK